MGNKRKTALLGGDMRQYYAALRLAEYGWEPILWGRPQTGQNTPLSGCSDWREAIAGAAVILLPLPASRDGETLNCPAQQTPTRLAEILAQAGTGCVVAGGKIPGHIADMAKEGGHLVFDYYDSEDFQIRNAAVTAEAAVALGMQSLERTLAGARVAVVGFGRIARCLAPLPARLGARVTVAARRESDLAYAAVAGYETLRICSDAQDADCLLPLARGYDILYNTVPAWLFGESFLEKTDAGTLFVDLASAPGGVDAGAAENYGIRLIRARSLPGQYAPVSAGELVGDCVERFLRGEVKTE